MCGFIVTYGIHFHGVITCQSDMRIRWLSCASATRARARTADSMDSKLESIFVWVYRTILNPFSRRNNVPKCYVDSVPAMRQRDPRARARRRPHPRAARAAAAGTELAQTAFARPRRPGKRTHRMGTSRRAGNFAAAGPQSPPGARGRRPHANAHNNAPAPKRVYDSPVALHELTTTGRRRNRVARRVT